MAGYVRIYRDIMKHHMLQPAKFSKLEVWLWMLFEASWKTRRLDVMGKTVIIERGQFCASYRFMASRWGWSVGSVQRIISRFSKEKMIRTKTDTGQLVITICKYEEYQNDAPDGDTEAIQERYTSDTNKNKGEERVIISSSVRPAEKIMNSLTEFLPKDLAQAVVTHRETIKKKLSPYAAARLAAAIGRCDDPIEAANMMIDKSWLSVKQEWINNSKKGTGNGKARRCDDAGDERIERAKGLWDRIGEEYGLDS